MALAKKYRLARFSGSRKSFEGKLFKLNSLSDVGGLPRFAFVVSSRVAKKATLRNKIRRYFQEGVKEVLSIVKPGGYIFQAKPEVADKDFAEVKNEILKNLKLWGFLKNE